MENRERGMFQTVLHFFVAPPGRPRYSRETSPTISGGKTMKIKYLGHAAFELALASGARFVIDPYTAGAFGTLKYAPIEGNFDVAVVSHSHEDHVSREVLSHCMRIINASGKVTLGDVTVELLMSYHDGTKGSARGKNLISIVEAEGLRVAHLGDLGHAIVPKDFPMLKWMDVLMIPVGGHFTIDAAAAAEIAKSFEPKIVIPMHYLTPKIDFPITPVENFTKLMDTVEVAGRNEIEVTKETLPKTMKVVVLEPAN
jgi:L-ascorbate metabolism protein UlaG (beta-lactamase superfamily)